VLTVLPHFNSATCLGDKSITVVLDEVKSSGSFSRTVSADLFSPVCGLDDSVSDEHDGIFILEIIS